MNLENLSAREKVIVIVTVVAAVFMVCWYLLLVPMLNTVDKTKADIKVTADTIKRIKEAPVTNVAAGSKAKLLQKDEELSYIVDYVYGKLNENQVKLQSMNQSYDSNKIIVDIYGKGQYSSLLSFLNSLSSMEAYFNIDNATIGQEGEDLAVRLRFTAPYK